jgi:hypothetical protein
LVWFLSLEDPIGPFEERQGPMRSDGSQTDSSAESRPAKDRSDDRDSGLALARLLLSWLEVGSHSLKQRFASPKQVGNGGKLGPWLGMSLDDIEVSCESESRR